MKRLLTTLLLLVTGALFASSEGFDAPPSVPHCIAIHIVNNTDKWVVVTIDGVDHNFTSHDVLTINSPVDVLPTMLVLSEMVSGIKISITEYSKSPENQLPLS